MDTSDGKPPPTKIDPCIIRAMEEEDEEYRRENRKLDIQLAVAMTVYVLAVAVAAYLFFPCKEPMLERTPDQPKTTSAK